MIIPCTARSPAILPAIAICFFRFQHISQKEAERIMPKTATANPFNNEIIYISLLLFSPMIISNLNYNIHKFQRQMFLIQNTYHIIEQTPVHTHRRHHLIKLNIHIKNVISVPYFFFATVGAAAFFSGITTLSKCQMSSTYSWIVLSDVNLPEHATLRIALLAQFFSSL